MNAKTASRSRWLPSIVVLVLSVTWPFGLRGAEGVPPWAQWRGPHRNGSSDDRGWEAQWPEEGPQNLWTAPLGDGYSSVVVNDGRLYTCGEGPEVQFEGKACRVELLYCLDPQSGNVHWQTPTSPTAESHRYGTWTCATPTAEDKVVYMLGRWGWLMAVDAASGKRLWGMDLNKETTASPPSYGYGASPLVIGDTLVLNIGSGGMGIDKRSGKVLWKTGGKSWPIPSAVPVNVDGQELALLMTDNTALQAVRPADGNVVWSYSLDKYPESGPPYSDPIVHGDRVLATTVYGSVLLSIADGKPAVIGRPDYAAGVCNPCLWQGHVYGFRAKDGLSPCGTLVCLDLAEGKILWEQPKLAGTLIAAGGKLIVQTLRGELVVAEASPEAYREISRTQVVPRTKDPMVTTPVLCDGKIYCRFRTELHCLDVRKPADKK